MSGYATLLRRPGGGSSTAYLLGIGSAVTAADGAYSLRLLSSDYTDDKCIKVRRDSDNTTSDVGFDVNGELDTAALLTFCGSSSGFVEVIYDQSSDASGVLRHRDRVQIVPANQPRIVNAGVLETKNGLPALRAPDQVRGMITGGFTAYVGNAVTAAIVGTLSTQTANNAPHFVSLIPTASGLNDSDVGGLGLLTRRDSVLVGKTETLRDSFATQDNTLWSYPVSNAVITSGQLVITPTSPYSTVSSINKYSLTDSNFVVQLVQRANRGNNTIENVAVARTDASNYVGFVVSGTLLIMRERANGSNSDLGATYDSVAHKYLRVRETAGTFYWDTSPDGTTWTNRRTRTRVMSAPTSVNIWLQAGYYGTEPGPLGTAIWDTVNPNAANTAAAIWSIQRNRALQVAATAVSGTLQQVIAQGQAALYTIIVDGVSTSATGPTANNYNFNRYGLWHDGVKPQSAQDIYWCEDIIWHSAINAIVRATVQLNQYAYWETPSQDTSPESDYTLVAEETYNDNVFRGADHMVYDNGRSTNSAIAWLASEVSVSNQRLRIAVRRTATPAVVGGTNYYRRGGAVFWLGPDDVAFERGGLWEMSIRMDECAAFGVAVLGWPAINAGWPIYGEIDMLELYPSNVTKFGGESNMHLDVVANSGRHLKFPTTAAHSPAGLVTAGNYQVNWQNFHKLSCLWIPDQKIEMRVDDVLVGYTTDQTYVPHGANAIPMRVGVQSEGLGMPDSAADFNTHYIEVDYFRYYALN